MKLQVLLTLLIIALITACRGPDPNQTQNSIKKQNLANQVRKKVALRLKEKTAMRPAGTVGQMHDRIEVLGLSFLCNKSIDIVDGRKLLIEAVGEMLNEINQEKEIHPFLCRYPFVPKNIEITIFLRTPDDRDPPVGALSVIDAREGYLHYEIHHPTKSGYITVYKETYAEALERLADPSLPLAAFEPDREISEEEFKKLKSGIGFVSDDGAIWHLGENGSWVRDPK